MVLQCVKAADKVSGVVQKILAVLCQNQGVSLSVKEIARVTGRGESTVTSQLTRGRELLRKALKGEYDFG